MMKQETADSGWLPFSVDGQLVGELGERLVTRNHIALAELIKNAYDADATKCEVLIDVDSSTIIVEDDGNGMTYDNVRKHWMRIGTANKLATPVSPRFGRPRTGNKGIGRFACQRLGERLVLETAARSGKRIQETVVDFDWDQYKPGIDIAEIENPYTSLLDKGHATKTILKIENLRESWTQGDINTLRRETIELAAIRDVRRDGFEDDPGMEIVVRTPGFKEVESVLLSQFEDAGWGRLTATVSESGEAILKLDAKGSTRKETKVDTKCPDLAGVEFSIAFLPMVRDYWRNPSVVRSATVKEILREQGGIRIYLNEFRVFPYGGPDDDWLGLEFDTARRFARLTDQHLHNLAKKLGLNPKRALLDAPRYRSLVGRVYISQRKNGAFEPKMDREGFVENNALKALRALVRHAVHWLTVYYGLYKKRRKSEQRKKAAMELATMFRSADDGSDIRPATVHDALAWIDRTVSESLPKPGDETETAKKATELVRSVLDEQTAALASLRSFHATGGLVFSFNHEVRNVIHELKSTTNYLTHIAKRLATKEKEQLLALAEKLTTSENRLLQLSKLFNMMSSSRSVELERFRIKPLLDRVLEGFGIVQSELAVSFEVHARENLVSPEITEAELLSVFVNLVSNAVKAVYNSARREIRIEAFSDGDQLTIRVCDTGIGLDETHWKTVLQPMVADPSGELYVDDFDSIDDDLKDSLLGRGSGIGLSVVDDISQQYGGKVFFEAPPDDFSTSIVVVLPYDKEDN